MKSLTTQKGVTLIEVLVTMVVVAVGLFGAAGLQLAAIRYDQTARFRTAALFELQQIRERMNANVDGVTAGGYLAEEDYASAATPADDPGCGLAGLPDCDAANAAQRDMRQWRLDLAQDLPGGRGAIYSVSTDPAARRVIVMWNEKSDSDDNGAGGATDLNCPTPRVGGVRCLAMEVTP